ncbi:polymorphic toxin-type HINT domain-containing protein [Actinomadura geliboluensis]|uniref:polymorphic toxin-type HINT domain-containing protein n=1 Tax=Actinomadura geliboluensis TaxID=882440 RepID=UPI00371B3D29
MPGTAVLMADGSTKPIDKIKVGDKVLATDPTTGKTAPQPVLATISRTGAKHLVRLTVDTDGDHGDKTGTLVATDNHPFWVPAAGKWIDAGKLKPGTWLRTSAGTHVQLTATKTWTQHQRVHNLTVAIDHTYYVEAGDTRVLVHNCPEMARGALNDEAYSRIENAYGPKVAEGVDHNVQRMHDGSATAVDHDIPRIGHDPDALGEYFADWLSRDMTHVDTTTGARVAYDSERGVLIIQTAYRIHGYVYNEDTFEASGRYVLS